MLRPWKLLLVIAAAMCSCIPTRAAEDRTITIQSLLAEMVDFDAVARWPQIEYACRQESSYDRRSQTPKDPAVWFANEDNMDQPTDAWKWEDRQGRREWVLVDVAGPGCVVRFWTGGSPPIGTVRFYLDGSEEPAIAAGLGDLLGGKAFVPHPLGITNAGDAKNLYLPVPYAKRCRITYEQKEKNGRGRPPGRWYNIEYRTYVPGTKVETFTMEKFHALKPAVERVCKTLLDPPALDGRGVLFDRTIEPGKEAPLDLPVGPAAVRMIELRLEGTAAEHAEQSLRSTVLRATFDGEETIWCPVGEFFGSGVGLQELESWHRTVTKDGAMTCRWTMPYKSTGRIALSNLGQQPVGAKLKVTTGDWKWDDRSMHFHATWRYQYPISTRPFCDWNYVSVAGKGVYLGDTLAIMNPAAAWWGEGDEKIWVDGEDFPSHFGTGSEDYYGYAWGNAAVFQGPFCNQPRAGVRNRGHTTNTRTRSLDAIPFTKSLQFDMEVWHWAKCNVAYSVASYWYALPGAKDNRPPQPDEAAAAIPGGSTVIRGAIECEGMPVLSMPEGTNIVKQTGNALPGGGWSGDAQILVQTRRVGDVLELLVAEKTTGAKKVVLYGTKSYDYGILRFSVNGKAVEKTFDGYSPEPVLSGPIELGVFDPKDGRMVLRVEVEGANANSKGPKYYFGLDAVVLGAP